MTAPGAAGSAGDWWGTEDVSVRFGDTLALPLGALAALVTFWALRGLPVPPRGAAGAR